MPVKSILTYVDRSTADEVRFAAAVAAAARFDAHLSVVSLGIVPDLLVDPMSGVSVMSFDAEMQLRTGDQARENAERHGEKIAAEGLRGEAYSLITTPSQLADRFGALARFSDLVVLSGGNPHEGDVNARAAFEAAIFQGDAAALVCPSTANLTPKRAMIAWDGSVTALRAVRRAYPLLSGADDIEIAMVDPSTWQATTAEELAVMLSRYGLSVSVYSGLSHDMSEAETLSRRQVEIGAEVTVLGGYAHPRFREVVLGGVTRELPDISNTPLLMAH